MKYLIIILFFLSCSSTQIDFGEDQYKDYQLYQSGEQKFGFATAKINGQIWRASSELFVSHDEGQKAGVAFNTFADNLVREHFGFSVINLSNLCDYYNLKPSTRIAPNTVLNECDLSASLVIFADDGHIVGQEYIVDEAFDNWFKITEWNEASGIIKGEFQLSMLRDEENLPSWDTYAKRITILDGYFECTEEQ